MTEYPGQFTCGTLHSAQTRFETRSNGRMLKLNCLYYVWGKEKGIGEEQSSIAMLWKGFYQAKPKLEPSCPLATIVNCRTASRVRRVDREPLAENKDVNDNENNLSSDEDFAHIPKHCLYQGVLGFWTCTRMSEIVLRRRISLSSITFRGRNGHRVGYQGSTLCFPKVLLQQGQRITRRDSGQLTWAKCQQSRPVMNA